MIARGLRLHFLSSLRLNLRSRRALGYGYLMPILFLLGFGSIFRSGIPLLYHQMGQLLTISILGGACFGMPTTIVAEREQGVWKRYRLLPVPTGALLLSTLCARLVIVASAALLQILLARLVYGTPFPANPWSFALGFTFVTLSFLGLGLLVAGLADEVPSVQALGQCLFLPMVMIGGVGVPLAVLPEWARAASGFMPGRYAVEILNAAYCSPTALLHTGYNFVALAGIGLAAGTVGLLHFRWAPGQGHGRGKLSLLGLALSAWLLVGLGAAATGKLQPLEFRGSAYQDITDPLIDSITYEQLPEDDGLVTRIAPRYFRNEVPPGPRAFAQKLAAWAPSHVDDKGQAILNLLSAASIADVAQDLQEADIGRLVLMQLKKDYDRETLLKALAWIALYPEAGEVPSVAPELGLTKSVHPTLVRQRNAIYAKKYLGRLLNKISD
jgi:ABC-2 type transport system permease protein